MTQQRPHLPHSPRHGETFELEIDGLSLKGLGTAAFPCVVGPQEESKDYTMQVRKAVPGDRVRVSVERRKKRTITARIDEILEPSPMRIEPRCKHFGRREVRGEGCGGCTLQLMSYRHQLANKERIIKGLMQGRGVDPGHVMPIIGQDEPWYYRNKMEFSFGDTADREFALGLYPKGYRYEVLNLDECYLQSEFVSEFLPKVRQWAIERGLAPYQGNKDEGFLRTLTIREGKRTGERMIELTTTHDETALCDGKEMAAADIAQMFCGFVVFACEQMGESVSSLYWTQHRAVRGEPTRFIEHHLYGSPVLVEQMHLPDDQVLSFEIHPRAFFQPNTLQAEVLYAQVLEKTGLRDAERGKARVLDLYCGTGTIGLCMAPYAKHVVGIELQPDAVDNARQNAGQNGIDNVTFFAGDVGDVLSQDDFKKAAGAVDIVVVDPPRAGLLPEAREQLKQIDAPRLVYVSCNPKALARDLAELCEFGYTIETIQPVDMFPHTYHVENVALLEKA
ncbi:23S rRNA (uracil(1939)-C(5))-methyltransferase RlmD [Persicimonas caeni]|nr:23S rRNA (uracil(1939)-C(5))-methyltransferase RlmD [Persicimonas caeni]